MAIRVAINGFGRTGRLALRAGFDEPDLDFVAINDLADAETLAYLLQFDSVHGLADYDIAMTEQGFSLDGQEIAVLGEKDPAKLPWKELDIDLVIESSGLFTSRDAAQAHLDAGARRVLITAPAKGVDGTFVIGVNEDSYDPGKHYIVSTASCTTNCLAVIAKVLHERFEIVHGLALTMHAYTNTQALLDRPVGKLRRSRAAALNLVPSTTGAALTINDVLPELSGRLDALAVRSPNPAGSLLDLTVLLQHDADATEINDAFKDASQTEGLQEVLLVSHDPLVSTDIVGTSVSAIIDAESTLTKGNLAKVLAWYDNEWGYSCRVVDFAVLMAQG